MKKTKNNISNFLTGTLAAGAGGYLLAGGYEEGCGFFGYIERLNLVFQAPFYNWWNQFSVIGILAGTALFEMVFLYLLVAKKNYMHGREYGTSRWAAPENVNARLADRDDSADNPDSLKAISRTGFGGRMKTFVVNTRNRQLSQHIRMKLDTRHTDLNNNIFVIGGSGAGKTFRFVKPNLMTCSSSFICTDPKGEIMQSSAGFLKSKGYKIRVLNLLNEDGMRRSTRYNPFVYLKTDADVLKLVKNFMANTKAKDSGGGGDQFWEDSACGLLNALVFYVWKEGVLIGGRTDHSFKGVVRLLRKAEFRENPQTMAKEDSELDEIMEELAALEEQRREEDPERPEHPALIYYNQTMRGAADTVRSIIQTLNSRFGAIQNETVLDLLSEDEIDIESIGEEKTAVFCVIPDNDKTFNFLIGMLYSQMFQIMYYQADFIYGGALPVHVTFMKDELANVALPDDFLSLLSTMRSRNISSVIIVQALAQVKKLFKDTEWENITANCDTTVYLGSNEQAAHKYVSEMLGKMTIDKASSSISRGKNGSTSRSDDVLGRELLLPDEVRKTDGKKCILFIRGFDPVIDDKIHTPELPFWKQFCRTAENFEFDGRVERYERRRQAGQPADASTGTRAAAQVYSAKDLRALEKKDAAARKSWEKERDVAVKTGEEVPRQPAARVLTITASQLFSMDEERVNEIYGSVTKAVLEETAGSGQETGQGLFQGWEKQDLLLPGAELQKQFQTDKKRQDQEVEDGRMHAGGPEGIQDIREDFFKELLEAEYGEDQAAAVCGMVPHMEHVNAALALSMFPLDMEAGDIREYICAFYA